MVDQAPSQSDSALVSFERLAPMRHSVGYGSFRTLGSGGHVIKSVPEKAFKLIFSGQVDFEGGFESTEVGLS